MALLFDTPGLSLSSLPIASTSTTNQAAKKRKRNDSGPDSAEQLHQQSTSGGSGKASGGGGAVEMNLGKLMKKMKEMEKDSGWGGIMGAGGKSGVEQSEKDGKKMEGKKAANAGNVGGAGGKKKESGSNGIPVKKDGAVGGGGVSKAGKGVGKAASPLIKPKPNRFEPAKKEKKSKKEKFSPASSSNLTTRHPDSTYEPEPEVFKAPTRHAAPNSEEVEADSTSAPQTNMQLALRAKLAGGKFRLLNETLYTSTGEEAWATMKEEGAFDDYHAGFRSQAAHWPTHPLTILTDSLSQLPPSTLIADFGCGDAALARSLALKGLKVISFDLVSKDGWVIEAECSSVPLPGGKKGGAIVDVVVCCLSLMGTDWVEMIREARRVLVDGGALRIAEVTSRFNDIDAFIALIGVMGFELTHKDTKNTHFVMFDFEKVGGAEDRKGDNTKKAATLLKPCIYKKR